MTLSEMDATDNPCNSLEIRRKGLRTEVLVQRLLELLHAQALLQPDHVDVVAAGNPLAQVAQALQFSSTCESQAPMVRGAHVKT